MSGSPNGSPGTASDAPQGQEIHFKEKCNKLQYLEERQREMCGRSQNIIKAVSIGAQMSIEECQFQFRSSRWNCSTFSNTTNIFGRIIELPTRETAFVYAITAAGVAYSVSRACAKGDLNECSCDERLRARAKPAKWEWGGCSENIHYGEKFSREFVDARESRDIKFGLMNLHNNEAGRRSIRSRMKRVCKCHGMSGSCSVRVCWRKLPNFREVGDALSARYDGATRVKMVERKDRRKKLRPFKKYLKPPNKTDLVFLEDSPSYCEPDNTLNILGTHGRLCNFSSLGMDGCALLCCGRGYQTLMREKEEKCQCRFIWCCTVQCETCRYKKDEQMCN